MNDLIRVRFDNERPTVMGRDLHNALCIRTAYKDWFPRMCEYGFTEGTDFCSVLSESTGGRPSMDHQMTIDMAKEICMLQRTEIGKRYREYFLELERHWNSPEAVMARALQYANDQIMLMTKKNERLAEITAVQAQQIAELQPKATYYDRVLSCPDALSISIIAKDYGWSAKSMNQFLHERGVQYKMNKTWLLYARYADKGYTKSETFPYTDNDGVIHNAVHTKWTQQGRLFIYELMKANGHLPDMERVD
jgi:anti-repressor protein